MFRLRKQQLQNLVMLHFRDSKPGNGKNNGTRCCWFLATVAISLGTIVSMASYLFLRVNVILNNYVECFIKFIS